MAVLSVAVGTLGVVGGGARTPFDTDRAAAWSPNASSPALRPFRSPRGRCLDSDPSTRSYVCRSLTGVENLRRTVRGMNDAVRQSGPTPVWVLAVDATGRLAGPCQDAGITSRRALLIAATDDVDVFTSAVERYGVPAPTKRKGDLLPAGVVQAVAESIVEPVRSRPGRLLARCGDGTDGAVVVDGELRVPWADLGALVDLAQ